MGEIITFYSYKGGTGRSMALANTVAATAIREPKKRILMIDWDLEAPGLEHYFQKYIPPSVILEKEGIFDFVKKANKELPKMPYGEENKKKLTAFFKKLTGYLIPVNIHPDATKDLWLLKAGKATDSYSDDINTFKWDSFYNKIPSFFTLFAEYLSEHFDYVFIDARTGHTGIGGISTMLMPEKLVLVFTPNRQGLEGIVKVARKATNYRMNSGDLRPLLIYPLPSRVDERAVSLREEWRGTYERTFTDLFQDVYALPSSISLAKYFDKVQIPHSSEYSYGEKIAVLEENATINSVSENYTIFAKQLLGSEKIWENTPFSDLEKPYQLFFVFTEQDRKYAVELSKHLKILERQNIVQIRTSNATYLSIEEWEDRAKRSVAENIYDLFIVFTSNSFIEARESWDRYLKFDSSNQKLLINIDVSKTPDDIASYPLTPSRREGISQSQNPDESWERVITDIRNKLIQYNGTRKSKSSIVA